MAYKTFTVSIKNSEAAEEALNAFMRSHSVLDVDRRWVDQGANSFWSFCVDYLDPAISSGKGSRQESKRPKVDYRDVLNEADFALFAKLRDLRKEVAAEGGVPVYAVFNNEQLATIVQNKAKTKTDLEAIIGVGDARIEKYGERFLARLSEELANGNEENRESV